jgi:hypothetical protein
LLRYTAQLEDTVLLPQGRHTPKATAQKTVLELEVADELTRFESKKKPLSNNKSNTKPVCHPMLLNSNFHDSKTGISAYAVPLPSGNQTSLIF